MIDLPMTEPLTHLEWVLAGLCAVLLCFVLLGLIPWGVDVIAFLMEGLR